MAQPKQLEPVEEDIEMMDEIEIAKYRRMATDALTGNFAVHIYGGQSQVEVLARALERCVDEVAHLANVLDSQDEDEDETTKEKLEQSESDLEAATDKLNKIRAVLSEEATA